MEYDNVNHPKHYMEGGPAARNIECIDITRYLPFSLGNAVKYVWRSGNKGGTDKAMEDLDKALWYLDDWMAMLDDLPTPVRDTYLRAVSYVAPLARLIVPEVQKANGVDHLKAAFVRAAVNAPQEKELQVIRIQRLKELYQKKQDMGVGGE
jgi:hypothetical protein